MRARGKVTVELLEQLKELEKKLGPALDSLRQGQVTLRAELTELAQKMALTPFGVQTHAGEKVGELINLITGGAGVKAFLAGNTPTVGIEVPAALLGLKNTIVNPGGSGQPLVQGDRAEGRGIVHAPQQRLTIRALFTATPTDSNMIERPTEATFTNNAGIQGGDVSPTGTGEGAQKPQSDMTFTLAQTAIVTIAHFIAASRQVLSDAPLLRFHLENRLLWGLNQKEETQMLTGDGTAGSMSGITTQATAFSGGATNQTRLDTLAKGANQLAVGNYEPSAFILNPTDWLACQLEKDSTGRYILGDPGAAAAPMLWGKPVVPTPSMTLGKFVCIDAARYGYIADRETATIRISENVNDAFIRNLIHVLCEKRTALVTELGGAAVYGDLVTAG
jgi:HK97 family phage major capsid protein